MLEEMENRFESIGEIKLACIICSFRSYKDALTIINSPQAIADIMADIEAVNYDTDIEIERFSKWVKYWLSVPLYNDADKVVKQHVPYALSRACILVRNGFYRSLEDALEHCTTLKAFAITACLQWVDCGEASRLASFDVAELNERIENGEC